MLAIPFELLRDGSITKLVRGLVEREKWSCLVLDKWLKLKRLSEMADQGSYVTPPLVQQSK